MPLVLTSVEIHKIMQDNREVRAERDRLLGKLRKVKELARERHKTHLPYLLTLLEDIEFEVSDE